MDVDVGADEGECVLVGVNDMGLWATPSSCVMLLSCGDTGMGEMATLRFFPARVTRVVAGVVSLHVLGCWRGSTAVLAATAA